MHTSNIALMSDNRAANYNASCNVLIDAIDVNTLGSILITCMTEAAYQMHITYTEAICAKHFSREFLICCRVQS